jgi:hypothetical protein
MTWWVKVVDELRAERDAFVTAWEHRRTGGKSRGKHKSKRGGGKKKSTRSKGGLARSPKARWQATQRSAQNSKWGKALTVRTVTPVKMDGPEKDAGYQVQHADLEGVTPGERMAMRFHGVAQRANDARWEQKGEWAVKWEGPGGLQRSERFATSDEAYWFCHGQNGALPRRVLADDRMRFTVGIYFRDEDEYVDPWGDDALRKLDERGGQERAERQREEMYRGQMHRDLRATGGGSPSSGLSELFALIGRR